MFSQTLSLRTAFGQDHGTYLAYRNPGWLITEVTWNHHWIRPLPVSINKSIWKITSVGQKKTVWPVYPMISEKLPCLAHTIDLVWSPFLLLFLIRKSQQFSSPATHRLPSSHSTRPPGDAVPAAVSVARRRATGGDGTVGGLERGSA